MNRQRKIATNVGKDTHVRSYQGNAFKQQSSKTFQVIAGEISKTEPEPLFRQTMVEVSLGRGGDIPSVAYPGAFIDPATGNLHGTYEGPIAGQMVMVGFENGNMNSPFVVNRYPYQGKGDTSVEQKYNNPVINASFDVEDVIIGHYSGSFLSFNTGILSVKNPGSATLNVATNLEVLVETDLLIDVAVNTEINAEIITLAGNTQIELNGNTNYAVKYTELKTAFDQFVSDYNNFVTTIYNLHNHPTAPIGPVSVPSVGGSSTTADMANSRNDTVLM